MKYFNPKLKKEPKAFRQWKKQELPRLMAIYRSGSPLVGRTIFEHLHSNLPNEQDSDHYYYSKLQLKQSLLEDQGYLCCYCNRLLIFDPSSDQSSVENTLPTEVEHLATVTLQPKRALDYTNLMVSCDGGRLDPSGKQKKNVPEKHLTCNAARGSKPLNVTPEQPDCEVRVQYALNGEAFGMDSKADDTVTLLNLKKFSEDRRKAIEGWIYESGDIESGYISRSEAIQCIQQLQEKHNGKFYSFSSAIIQIIQREILNQP